MKVEIVNERTNSSELEFSKNSNVLFGGVCNPISPKTIRVSTLELDPYTKIDIGARFSTLCKMLSSGPLHTHGVYCYVASWIMWGTLVQKFQRRRSKTGAKATACQKHWLLCRQRGLLPNASRGKSRASQSQR